MPDSWPRHLGRFVPFFRKLSPARREAFLERLKIFVGEKHFIAAGGMHITEQAKVVISAWAVLLVLELDISYYDRLTEIVVYPGDFLRPDEEDPYLGEAHNWGVVVISWEAVRDLGSGEGLNTAIHEFAHVLDRADGGFDGTPRLASAEDYERWSKVMTRHFERLRRGSRAESEVLDDYGAENEAEFFSVASETFFMRPWDLKDGLPDLYAVLKRFYRQDPAAELSSTLDERRFEDAD